MIYEDDEEMIDSFQVPKEDSYTKQIFDKANGNSIKKDGEKKST